MMEFALILPLLLLLVLGIMEAGRMLAIYSSLSSAARQAARYGAVSGDVQAGLKYYLDCQGMRNTAKRASLFGTIGDGDIAITYDRGSGAVTGTVAMCATGAVSPTQTVANGLPLRDGDRVVISVTTTYRPIVPIIPIPPMPMTFAAARTIFTTIIGPTATPLPNPDLRVVKRDSPDPAPPGGTITYAITVTNASAASNASQVTLTDTLPVQITSVDLSTVTGWSCAPIPGSPIRVRCTRAAPLTPGLSAGLQYQVTAPTNGPVTITNTVTVGSSKPDYYADDNTTSTTTFVAGGADMTVSKTASTDLIGGGLPLTYTLVATNNGSARADPPIVMTDTLPVGVEFVSVSSAGNGPEKWDCMVVGGGSVRCVRGRILDPNASAPEVTVVVRAPLSLGQLVNRAEVQASTIDPLPLNNTATVTSTITTDADLVLTKLGATQVDGGTFIYTLRVVNRGPSVARNVRLTDPIPDQLQILNITPGASWDSCPRTGNTVVCTYTQDLPPQGAGNNTTSDVVIQVQVPEANLQVSNTATVTSDQPDPAGGTNSATIVTDIRDCRRGRVDPANSTIGASPSDVLADGTSTSQVLVTLRDKCGDPVTAANTVQLSSGHPINSTVAFDNIGSNGQIAFNVSSATPGTATFNASATSGTYGTVALNATTDVRFFSCVRLDLAPVAGSQYIRLDVTNNSGQAWRLASLLLDWPSQGSGNKQVQSIALGPNTIWNGPTNADPLQIPGGGLDWTGQADWRLVNSGSVAQLQLNFTYNLDKTGAYDLTTTWDDGNGHQCTATPPATIRR